MSSITVSLKKAIELNQKGWCKKTRMSYSVKDDPDAVYPCDIFEKNEDGELCWKPLPMPTAQEILDELPKHIKGREVQIDMSFCKLGFYCAIGYLSDGDQGHLSIVKSIDIQENSANALADLRIRAKKEGYLDTNK